MAGNENTMELQTNPYDQLVDEQNVPVQSPVIFSRTEGGKAQMKTEKTEELIPLVSDVIYGKVQTKEYTDTLDIYFEVEEDLLVPDIEPDMESILNVDGKIDSVNVTDDGSGLLTARGEVRLETMYRSSGSYGDTVCVIPASVPFSAALKDCKEPVGNLAVRILIKKIEYRIINERKYRIRIQLHLCLKIMKDCEHQIFEGIKDQPLQVKKENVRFCDLISRKNKESDVDETLMINDEKIRPVKIIKYKFVVSENHQQITKEKMILNQTIWVRALYLAEISSKGNLSNQPRMYQGKINHTQFIALGKNETDMSAGCAHSSADGLTLEINNEVNGFRVTGNISTEIDLFSFVEREAAADFYHMKEEIICDSHSEKICCGVQSLVFDHTLKENISFQQEQPDELRVIYLDAQIIESRAGIDGSIQGKMQLEVVSMNDGDFTVLAKKLCDFAFAEEMPAAVSRMELENIFVKEMTADIVGSDQVSVTAHIQIQVNMYEEKQFTCISNPCIVRGGDKHRYYPITVYTVKAGDSVWSIAKKFKVSEEQIINTNTLENIRPGKKIVIVK